MFRIKQRTELIVDFLYLVDLEKVFKNKNYILVVKPESVEVQMQEKIQSDVTDVKDRLKRGLTVLGSQ